MILLRLAPEINLKSSKVREDFKKILINNIKEALNKYSNFLEVKADVGRIYISSDDDSKLIKPLLNIFGLSSFSIVEHKSLPELKDMCRVAKTFYAEKVKGKSFAIRVHRSRIKELRSIDVEREVGAAVFPFSGKVNLKSPEILINIDLRPEGAFFYTNKYICPGGFPVGSQGKALCLISGGFDSAVAAWMMLKRGVELDYLFCNLAGSSYERSVLTVVKTLHELWSKGSKPKMYVLDFNSCVKEIKKKVPAKYSQIILKRIFYKAANFIAERSRSLAIVTGESLGQVSSQTLYSLCAINEVSKVPVFRPLIGSDKIEIIDLSKKIGTYSLSKHVQEYCDLTGKAKPVTHANAERARLNEKDIDDNILTESFSNPKIFNIDKIEPEDFLDDYLFIKTIPKDAEVIDCRSPEEFNLWHYPLSKNLEFNELNNNFSNLLNKNQTYVIYCTFGTKSALIAEKMQHAGFEAYSIYGGLKFFRT